MTEMMRVWIVDDMIPLEKLYNGPYPVRIDTDIVRKLVGEHHWDEEPVLALCSAICGGEYEAAFFKSPEAMVFTLAEGFRPPHVIIFDWEYGLAVSVAKKLEALQVVLSNTFAYVQIYTHTDTATIDGLVGDLGTKFSPRLLRTRGKEDVSPDQLTAEIRAAWEGTIAGELADRVRRLVSSAVEHTLIDMCSVKREVLAAIADQRPENMVQVVLSRIRDEIALSEEDVFATMLAGLGGNQVATTDELRKLMSVWYYSFPSDSRVRRGDIIEMEGGGLGLVVTPACDLVNFPKKTGRRLTWIRIAPFTDDSLRALKAAGGMSFGGSGGIGESIVAKHGDSGDAIVLLPNMPQRWGRRDVLEDHLILCHEWETRIFNSTEAAIGQPLKYDQLIGVTRRCTLAEPFVAAVVTKVTSAITRPGTADMPASERKRLTDIATASRAAPPAPAAARANAPATPPPAPQVLTAVSELPVSGATRVSEDPEPKD